MISSSGTGRVAMSGPGGGERPLRQPEQGAAAARADPLVVAALAQPVVEAQLGLDLLQIRHPQLGGEGLFAAEAELLWRARPHVLVEADSELRRSLEEVEQLAEGQPEQG